MEGTPVQLSSKADTMRALGADKELEDDDPFELIGVRYPVEPGVDADRVLARCFVEEYALIGWTPSKVRMLFETPQFAGAHDVRRRRGPDLIEEVIAEVFGHEVAGHDATGVADPADPSEEVT